MTRLRSALEVRAEASSVRLGPVIKKIDAAASVGKFSVEIRYADIHIADVENETFQQHGYSVESYYDDETESRMFKISW